MLGTEPTLHAAPIPAAKTSRWPWLGAVGLVVLATGLWLGWPSGGAKIPPATTPLLPTPAPAPVSGTRPVHSAPNSLGLRFLPVPLPDGTSVEMGEWEVRRQDFRLYRQEVTERRWKGIAGSPPEVEPNWAKPGFEQAENHPVVFVSWQEADDFCRWLTSAERGAGRLPADREYRLPMEIEWTAAAGPGVHPWGNEWPPPPASGNFLVQPDWDWDDGWQWTAPVGRFLPNALGLHDLAGNVREWCLDPFSVEHENRAVRGGSYRVGDEAELRSRYRRGLAPTHRDGYTGFRLVRAATRR